MIENFSVSSLTNQCHRYIVAMAGPSGLVRKNRRQLSDGYGYGAHRQQPRRVNEMTRRKSILGVLALCALSVCAFGAANASAAGLTAVTCEEKGAGSKYNSSACATPAVAGNWETTQVPAGTVTEVTGTAVGTSVLKGTVALTKVEITCGKTATTGNLKNIEAGGEMKIEGTNIVNDYTECHASLEANTAKKCEVESITGTKGVKGTIATNSLKSLSGTEHKITFEPTTAGGAFAEFNILKGECLGATAKVTVTGSVIGIANTEKHHHITFTPATNGSNLKANGGAASYQGTYTLIMKGTANLIGAETF
jgi:hypothetical protein